MRKQVTRGVSSSLRKAPFLTAVCATGRERWVANITSSVVLACQTLDDIKANCPIFQRSGDMKKVFGHGQGPSCRHSSLRPVWLKARYSAGEMKQPAEAVT